MIDSDLDIEMSPADGACAQCGAPQDTVCRPSSVHTRRPFTAAQKAAQASILVEAASGSTTVPTAPSGSSWHLPAGGWAMLLGWPVLALISWLTDLMLTICGIPTPWTTIVAWPLVFGSAIGLWHYVKH